MIPKTLSPRIVPFLLVPVLLLPVSGCARTEGPGEPEPAPASGLTGGEAAQAAPKEESGGEWFELRIPEGAEEISRSSVPDPSAGASLDEVVFLYGGDTYTYRTRITGGLENISPFPDDYVRGEHDDLIPPETPRCYRNRAEGSGVLLWLSGDRMFSLSMTEGEDGEKLTSMRLLLTGAPNTNLKLKGKRGFLSEKAWQRYPTLSELSHAMLTRSTS